MDVQCVYCGHSLFKNKYGKYRDADGTNICKFRHSHAPSGIDADETSIVETYVFGRYAIEQGHLDDTEMRLEVLTYEANVRMDLPLNWARP